MLDPLRAGPPTTSSHMQPFTCGCSLSLLGMPTCLPACPLLLFPGRPTCRTPSYPPTLRPADRKGRRTICLNCGCHQTPQWRCGPLGPRTLCNACGVRYKKDLPLNCWPIRDGMMLPPVRAWALGRRGSLWGWGADGGGLRVGRNAAFFLGATAAVARRGLTCCNPLPTGLPPTQGAVLPPGFVVPPGITIHTQPAEQE